MEKTPYSENTDGTCPHCNTVVTFKKASKNYSRSSGYAPDQVLWLNASGENELIQADSSVCPSCKKPVVTLGIGNLDEGIREIRLAYPLEGSRIAPTEVPETIAKDFEEASVVLQYSEEASAALSRRCLQNILHEHGIVERSLSTEIDKVLPTLPSHISENLDAIRIVGNFAAHPIKETNTGTIIEVEPGEAEWTLDVLEMLFDHYYVKPALASKKREGINIKLTAAGKPPLKRP